jgi:cation diffusion facilitator family transporter
LVWYAGRHSTQAPDGDHPYGHARYEAVATLVLGGLLGLVAIGIGWDAGVRLFSPGELLAPEPIALYAALASILIKEWLYRYTLAYAKRVQSQMLRANAWHHRTDAISSVVVLVGVAGTMAGLPYLDAIAAILVAVMIAHIAWDLGAEAFRELVDTGLDTQRLAAVRQTILSVGGVRDVHMLRTRRLGGFASADVHILVDPRVSVSEGHLISVLVERRLKQEIDEVTDVTVHIDPEDDERVAPGFDLPLRAEAMLRLSRLWDGIPEAGERLHTVLHYLNGRIDVELFLPLGLCGGDPEQARRLRDRLQLAVKPDAAFNRITVFFG